IFIFAPLLKFMLLGTIPLSIISHFWDWDAFLQLSLSFSATLNLTWFLSEATDLLGKRVDPRNLGLLETSTGNIVKIIVGTVAILQGE
ncbi:hypothetical protein EV361DRAFT_765447, partial [Lentinula raphanica]